MSGKTIRACAVLAAGALVAGCTGDPGPQGTADQVGRALASADLTGVPLDGIDAATATAQAKGLLAGLGDRRPTVRLLAEPKADDQGAATARYHVSWPLAEGRLWEYDTSVPLVRKDGSWRARWSPAAALPGAQAGDTVTVTRTPAVRGRILSAGGTPIVQLRQVVRLGIDKSHGTPAQALSAAPQVAALAGLTDVAGYTARVQAAGPKAFVEAVVLRREDPKVAAIPKVAAANPTVAGAAAELPLAPTKTFARPVLGGVGEATAEIVEQSGGAVAPGDLVGQGGLQRVHDATLRGTPGMTVSLVRGGEARQLHTIAPVAGRDLATTLDVPAQTRAEALLAGVKPASAVVAIRPSTGDVLVAASGPGGQGQSTATLGTYAPGSTFKIVSTLALLRAGVTAATPTPCTAQVVVDGRRFENYDAYPDEGLGQVPLATAFAKSCNTAFIGLRDKTPSAALADAAAGLGLSSEPRVGLPVFLGGVPAATGQTDHAAQMIGQSAITASPLGMATVIASVVAGHPVAPRMVVPDAGKPSSAAAPPARPVTPAEAMALRALMRGVVTGGSGALLADLPGAPIAKTGTAEFGTTAPPRTHAWMVAARGDLAVAVFVDEGEGGSRTAGPILKAFLAGTR
ncbi:penicillin-binding transpeptidase domain-containing protein [Arsenicicoccus dermatophilus]|uniref:penicillin-binding transpeptidase domain-containing protein n=1 Tax=Arsenicicoccus dermatophilus TaxID=1076331 RepID=UPI003916F2AC